MCCQEINNMEFIRCQWHQGEVCLFLLAYLKLLGCSMHVNCLTTWQTMTLHALQKEKGLIFSAITMLYFFHIQPKVVIRKLSVKNPYEIILITYSVLKEVAI